MYSFTKFHSIAVARKKIGVFVEYNAHTMTDTSALSFTLSQRSLLVPSQQLFAWCNVLHHIRYTSQTRSQHT